MPCRMKKQQIRCNRLKQAAADFCFSTSRALFLLFDCEA